jgi:hypothetical protein
MSILVVGQEVQMPLVLNLKVLRAFAVEGNIFYIVGIKSNNSIIRNTIKTSMYAILRNDGTHSGITDEVINRANQLIIDEKLLDNLE